MGYARCLPFPTRVPPRVIERVTGENPMAVTLNNQWDKLAPLSEIVSLFLALDEALDGFLGDYSVRVRPSYSISAKNGSVDRRQRSEVVEAVDSLGGSPSAIVAQYYEPYDATWTGRSVRMAVNDIGGEVYVFLNVRGENEEIARGQFHILCNQISAEIDRKFPKPKIIKKSESRRHSVFSKILKHPIPSGLIVLILGTIILRVFGVI